MKNLLVSLSGYGAFILGVMLSFDVAGFIGRSLIRERPTSADDFQNLRADWQRIGGDFGAAISSAHEQR